MLLPDADADAFLTGWPTEAYVVDRTPTELDEAITPAALDEYVNLGCIPAAEIAAIKAPNPSLNRDAFMINGRTDAQKLNHLKENGFTLRLGNLQRVIPFMATLSRAIQNETGYSNYVHAFITPGGEQGLRHHWDQQLAVIVQLQGVKTWQLWRPPVEAPMREYNESFRVWRAEFIPEWEAAGPDLEVHLKPGQALVLPRGWVHNPHCRETDQESIHLTFAIRERTRFWLAEKLLAGAIQDPEFRRLILPRFITGAGLGAVAEEVRKQLLEYLDTVVAGDLVKSLRDAAMSELEYTT
ncbi:MULTISPECIES: JmjC domain-containing protein [unclassified Streptomyces]|uniref:JmjC domain-containing protein n=1 Tax=unclassified Streptomyces TaxID=2593676 RepID=UPI00093F3E34|nr:cupin domain-containing protein [Streptomyces sp. TSRI0281]OKI46535.1 cupin [Streptomyces sp. TSRI0281]